MSSHGYNSGRLDLPFVGVATFGKRPLVTDWDQIDAEVAVLGAPFDAGTQWRSGARFGPRAVREASTLFSFGHAGAYDHEDDRTYLGGDVRIVDIGDADIVHTNTTKSHANIRLGVEKILTSEALPVVIGGDHSINIPCIEAFAADCAIHGPLHVVQIDAHLDFVDERHGVTAGVVDDLGVDVLVGLEHGETGPLCRALHGLANPMVTPSPGVGTRSTHHTPAFPALRRTYSST